MNTNISANKLLWNVKEHSQKDTEQIINDVQTFFQINLQNKPEEQQRYIENLFNETYKSEIIYSVVIDNLRAKDFIEDRLPNDFTAESLLRDMYIQAEAHVQKYYHTVFKYCRSNIHDIKVFCLNNQWSTIIQKLIQFYAAAGRLIKMDAEKEPNEVKDVFKPIHDLPSDIPERNMLTKIYCPPETKDNLYHGLKTLAEKNFISQAGNIELFFGEQILTDEQAEERQGKYIDLRFSDNYQIGAFFIVLDEMYRTDLLKPNMKHLLIRQLFRKHKKVFDSNSIKRIINDEKTISQIPFIKKLITDEDFYDVDEYEEDL